MTLAKRKEQADLLFEVLAEPEISYNSGIFGKELSSYPNIISKKQACQISASKGVRVFFNSEIPSHLQSLIGSISPCRHKGDAFHYSNCNEFIVIEVSENSTENMVINNDLAVESHVQHILVLAKENSSVTISEEQVSAKGCDFHSHVVEIIAQKNAQVSYTIIQGLDKSTTQIGRRSARLDAKAQVRWYDLAMGGGHHRIRNHSTLDGERSEATHHALFVGSGLQFADVKTTMCHNASHTTSRFYAKSVLAGDAKAVHQGSSVIAKTRSHCDASQKEETLLLSNDSKISAVPMLRIGNQQVSCNHSTSISHLNEGSAFYLMSRGLSKAQAYLMMIEGFLMPIFSALDEQTITTLRGKVQAYISSIDLAQLTEE